MSPDVVVVGSGAGAGPLALVLSEAGFRVLVLEKGPHYKRTDFIHDEVQFLMDADIFVPSIDLDPHVLVDGSPCGPKRSRLGWIASCVGGGTAHMGGSLYRFHPDDFRMQERLGTIEEVADWPYAYDQLERYYCRAELAVGVSGQAGANPFEGRRSLPYPMAPLRSHPLASVLREACHSRSLHPFPTPRAINSRPYAGRPECAHCDFCSGYGCPVGARGSIPETLLARAAATGRCQVQAGVMVREVTLGRSGRVDGCIYLDQTGVEHRVRARIVCVCCSAVESARLLLLSRSARFPDGLANDSGRVGRHLQFHTNSGGRGRFRRELNLREALDDRTSFLGVSVMDHYFIPQNVTGFPKGGLLRFDMLRPAPIARAHEVAREGWPHGLLWGGELKRRLRDRLRNCRGVEFEVFQDFLPNARTFMQLDPEVKDCWGLPVARIHLASVAHHALAGRWLVDRGLEILEAAGADDVHASAGVGGVSHVMVHGTCRAGRNPATSVLNEFCQAHAVSNLFIVDGSFMPTSGGAPSTLTIIANSFRVADYILEYARKGI